MQISMIESYLRANRMFVDYSEVNNIYHFIAFLVYGHSMYLLCYCEKILFI
jgi:hypothetical protein